MALPSISSKTTATACPPKNATACSTCSRRTSPRVTAVAMGVRLATVKRIVELHGGRVWIEDADPRGARFCVTFRQAAETADSLPRQGLSGLDGPVAQEQGD